ncbi:MAG TPA: YbhN family protein [Thermoanaerobaculia bacterium]|nr:YbhN family protein [Thermoanaerobaculia bacterium]
MWRKKLKALGPYLLFLAVLIALGAYLRPRLGDFQASLRVAHQLDWRFLFLAATAQTISCLADADILTSIVGLSPRRLSLWRAAIIETAASTFCLVAGGVAGYTAAVFYWTRKSGVPARVAAVAGLLLTFFDGAAVVLVGVISAVLLLSTGKFHVRAFLPTLVIACIVGAALVIAVFILRRSRFASYCTVEQWRDSIARLGNGAWKRPAIAAALNIGFDIATLALIFTAAGVRLNLLTLLAGYGIPLLVGQATPVPGGVAITEVSMCAVYVSLGVQPSATLVSVFSYRLVSFWLPTLIGIPLMLRLQAVNRRRATASL